MVQLTRPHPPSLRPPLRGLAFVCPRCRGGLQVQDEGYRCPPCDRTYPLHGGIPDFRLFPDPYLDFEADRVRTDIVLSALDRLPFRELLDYYWSHSDVTPPALRERFIQNALRGEQRGRRVLQMLEGKAGRPARPILEVGSGTGNLLAAAAEAGVAVVGTDIAMRWLHVSRRRFLDRGLPEPALVCCCAEHLPFPDGAFDQAVCCATLEFARDSGQALGEAARVLSAEGLLYLETVNRYSLARDPYSYLWGVGFLPRAWQPRYVHWRRKTGYEIRRLSLGELRRTAGKHFPRIEFELPDIADESLRTLPFLVRAQVRVYRGVKRWPVFRHLLRRFGPQWDVWLTKGGGEGGTT